MTWCVSKMGRSIAVAVLVLCATLAVLTIVAPSDVDAASQRDVFSNAKVVELHNAAARTSTATGTGQDLAGHFRTGVATLSCGTVSGTSPTNTVTLDGSDDNSTWNAAQASFTQCTAACFQSVAVRKAYRYWRSVQTIGGTSPSFTCSVTLLMADPSSK